MFGFSQPNVPQIDAKDVMDAVNSKKNITLLDVRTEEEYARGRIEGSVNIPVNKISDKIESTIPEKDKTIYVYCLSGSRSISAVDTMVKMGYSNVFNMTSGLLSWRSKHYPISID